MVLPSRVGTTLFPLKIILTFFTPSIILYLPIPLQYHSHPTLLLYTHTPFSTILTLPTYHSHPFYQTSSFILILFINWYPSFLLYLFALYHNSNPILHTLPINPSTALTTKPVVTITSHHMMITPPSLTSFQGSSHRLTFFHHWGPIRGPRPVFSDLNFVGSSEGL